MNSFQSKSDSVQSKQTKSYAIQNVSNDSSHVCLSATTHATLSSQQIREYIESVEKKETPKYKIVSSQKRKHILKLKLVKDNSTIEEEEDPVRVFD